MLNVLVLYAVTIGIFVVTARLDNVFVWVAAFLVMGPIHARFAILMHESAHRLLFSNRRANDFVGKWLVALSRVRSDRPLPTRPHGAPPRGVRSERAGHPALLAGIRSRATR